MAELTDFNILTKSGRILPVTGAAGNPTITPRPIHNGGGVSFGLGANEVNGGMGGIYAVGVIDSGTPANSIVVDAGDYYETAPTTGSVLALHDQVTLTTPRHNFEMIDFMEWWDAATPGLKFITSLTINGSSGSALVTVSDIRGLTVGQSISSVGNTPIPAGTVIAGLYATPIIGATAPVFTVRLSQALVAIATASAATLTGANLVARIAVSDYQWHGEGLPVTIT